jgi:hypothetical protein
VDTNRAPGVEAAIERWLAERLEPPADDIVVTDPLLHLSCGDDEPP